MTRTQESMFFGLAVTDECVRIAIIVTLFVTFLLKPFFKSLFYDKKHTSLFTLVYPLQLVWF